MAGIESVTVEPLLVRKVNLRSKNFASEFDKIVGVLDGRVGVGVQVGLHLLHAVVGHRSREVMVELGLRHELPLVRRDGAEGVFDVFRRGHLKSGG